MKSDPKYQRNGAGLWIDTAHAILAKDGHGGLTIENLTVQTGKTRGSFYHHFGSHDAFISRLLDDWRQSNTERIAELIAKDHEPERRRTLLNREAGRLDAEVETAIRRWAGSNRTVAEVCRAVDERRLEVLAMELVALAESRGVQVTARQAEVLAFIDYAIFLGAQMLAPDGGLAALPEIGLVSEEMIGLYLQELKPESLSTIENDPQAE